MLAFVAGISMLTGLVFGLIPALRATQVDLSSAMKEHSRSVAASRTWLSKALLITQVAVSVMLLIGAGLFVRTLQNLRSVDVGFNPGNILMFRINPALNRYTPERTNQLYQRMQTSLDSAARRAAGVVQPHGAAVRQHQHHRHFPPGRDQQKEANDFHIMSVSPKFFATMQIPILLGRDFDERDVANPTASALINETAVEEVLPQ